MMRAELRADLDVIVDCMTGFDGGAAFVRLRVMLEALDQQAARGDSAAAECLAVVRRFRRLIDAAQNPSPKPEPAAEPTCPYCGARWLVASGICAAECAASRRAAEE